MNSKKNGIVIENPMHKLFETLNDVDMEYVEELQSDIDVVLTELVTVTSRVQDKVIDFMDKGEYEKAQEALKIPKLVKEASDYLNDIFYSETTQKELKFPPVDDYGTVTHIEEAPKPDKSTTTRVPLYQKQAKTKPIEIEIEGVRYGVPNHSWSGLFNYMCDRYYSVNQGHFAEWFSAIMDENKAICQAHESNVPSMMTGWHRICYSNLYIKIFGQPDVVKRYVLWLLKHFGITKDIYIIREEGKTWSRAPKNKEKNEKKADKGVKIGYVEPSLPVIKAESIVKHEQYGIGTVVAVDYRTHNSYAKVKFGDEYHSFRLKQGGTSELSIVQTA